MHSIKQYIHCRRHFPIFPVTSLDSDRRSFWMSNVHANVSCDDFPTFIQLIQEVLKLETRHTNALSGARSNSIFGDILPCPGTNLPDDSTGQLTLSRNTSSNLWRELGTRTDGKTAAKRVAMLHCSLDLAMITMMLMMLMTIIISSSSDKRTLIR